MSRLIFVLLAYLLLSSYANAGQPGEATPNTNAAEGQRVQLTKELSIRPECIAKSDTDLSKSEADDNFYRVATRWKQLNCRYRNVHGRKLVVLLDGTSNNKKTSTNIWRLYDLALRAADNNEPVIAYYDQGVGNDNLSKFTGNVFGSGVSLNIRQAYRFLAQVYQPGDKIYLIGFSRGAFTARSLNGFIEFAGLLDNNAIKPDWGDRLPEIAGLSHLHREVKDLYDMYFNRDNGAADFEPLLRARLKNYSKDHHLTMRQVKVEAIGVFDTVPALGLLRDEEPDDHRLGLYARRGYHAMSLDEQRDDFRLLRFFAPLLGDQTLEEVWFAGVHADVGGGYGAPEFSGCPPSNRLSKNAQPIGLEATPLRWMLRNFSADHIFAGSPWPVECLSGRLHDEFFDSVGIKKRVYQRSGLIKRHPLPGDKVDGSVLCRMQTEFNRSIRHPEREPHGYYRPANLGDHPQQTFDFLPRTCATTAIEYSTTDSIAPYEPASAARLAYVHEGMK